MALLQFYSSLPPGATAVLTLLAVWLSWYSWRFVLTPFLRPDEPKELPYFVPGHFPAMFRHADRLFAYGREYFGNTREPYNVTIMGDTICMVTAPEDIAIILNQPKAMVFGAVARDGLAALRLSKEVIEMYFDDSIHKSGQSWIKRTHHHFKEQLHPGPRLEEFQSPVLNRVDELMALRHVEPAATIAQGSDRMGDWKDVSLMRWGRFVLLDAIARAYFDPSIFELAPDLHHHFGIFLREQWKMQFQLPEFAAKKLYKSHRYLVVALQKYLELPLDRRTKECLLLRTVDDNVREMGVRGEQGANNMLVMHLLLLFWLMSHILFEPALQAEVRAELAGAFDKSGKLDMALLIDACPSLNALFDEALRYYTWTIGIREAVVPVVVHGKHLKPGTKVFMLYRQLHLDTAIYGEDVNEFNPRRFLGNSINKGSSFRPFGGGFTHCPGRWLARREILMFIALLLQRFDIELRPGPDGKPQKMPRMDNTLPSGGVQDVLGNDDVFLRIRERAI